MIVKVYSTQMGEKSVETSATTWGQLQNDLSKNGISYSGMKSVIGESKLTLEADAAILPTEGFTLFLMPKKTKAGAIDINTAGYKDLRAEICTILNGGKNEPAKTHFNEGKNYTTKGTEELRGLLASWKGVTLAPVEAVAKKKSAPKVVETSRPATTRQIIEKIEAIVESVKESKEEIEEVQTYASVGDPIIESRDQHSAITYLNSAVKELEYVDFSGASEDNEYLVDIQDTVNEAKDLLLSVAESFTAHLQMVAKAKAEKEAKEKAEAEARLKAKEEERLQAEEKRNEEQALRNQEAEMRRMFGDVQ